MANRGPTLGTILSCSVAPRHNGYNRNYRRPDLRQRYLIGQRPTTLTSPETAQLFMPSRFPYLDKPFAISLCVSSDKRVTNLPSLCHTPKSVVLYITARSACRLSGQAHTSNSAYGGGRLPRLLSGCTIGKPEPVL